MTSAEATGALMIESLRDPETVARKLLAMNLSPQIRWMALVAVSALAALVISISALLYPPADPDHASSFARLIEAPFPGFAIQVVSMLLLAGMVTIGGRVFGGRGRFADALTLVVWLEFLTVPPMILQLFFLMTVPFLTLPVALFTAAAFVWILLSFTATLHGFSNRLLVALGAVGTLFAFSLMLALVLTFMGIDPTIGTL